MNATQKSEGAGPLHFLDALKQGGLVFDGAMGTQLYERGVLYHTCFEELNLSSPELILSVHEDYLKVGACVIESNTFGANSMRLEKHGLSSKVREINLAAVKLARTATRNKAWVAGCVGPSGYFLGDASRADLEKVYHAFFDQISVLAEAKVDLILIETMRQSNELQTAISAALKACGEKIPIVASASVDEHGCTSDGISSDELARMMAGWGAQAVAVNCSDGPMNVMTAAQVMMKADLPVLALPNAGLPRRVDERLVYVSTPDYFGLYARRMFKLGIKAVGGCCGTTPDHIKRVAAAAKMVQNTLYFSYPSVVPPVPSFPPESDLPSSLEYSPEVNLRGAGESDSKGGRNMDLSCNDTVVPFEKRSSLSAKLAAKKFVVSVEVNPPVGLCPSKAIDSARMLKDAGVDVINIADGARAQARMANIALAVRIQRDVGIETMLHVCGRDRNLLGTLAHLLGAFDFGVHNLVIVTGDPPKTGDFPDATAVYDLDSIGILKLASRLNMGIDPAGKRLGGTTRFVLATGAEPAALNYDRELARLRQKKEAGAELVMTQPVYDPQILNKFLRDIEPLKMPVLVGILPLASYRNAEFLHHEVPGMQVPETIRERMRKAGSKVQARKEGITIAREMMAIVKSEAEGVYIMPPLERHELALEVLDGFMGSP